MHYNYLTTTGVIASGTMNLSDGTVEPDNRTVDPYMNITGFIGSNFSYTIIGLNPPPNVWEIRLNLTNPTALTVHDVCIVAKKCRALFPFSFYLAKSSVRIIIAFIRK